MPSRNYSDDDFRAGIGRRVMESRRALGLTFTDLSERTGLGRAFLCDIEHGRHQPAAWTLARLAEAFGVTIDWLVLGRR